MMEETQADWTGSNTDLSPCSGTFEIQDTAVEKTHTKHSEILT